MRLIRFYIDIPSAVVLIVLFIVFRDVIITEFIMPISDLLHIDLSKSTPITSIIIAAISSVIATTILGLLGWFIYSNVMRNALSGEFDVYNLVQNSNNTNNCLEEFWGVVTILYHPFALNRNGVKVKLRLKHDDVILEGSGLIINNRFIVGHYTEISKLERRRSGSFFYTLDGDGASWTGEYQYIDPNESSPKIGNGLWKRKST